MIGINVNYNILSDFVILTCNSLYLEIVYETPVPLVPNWVYFIGSFV